jgi:eukaryotic-like serine/threonine-protein kinase
MSPILATNPVSDAAMLCADSGGQASSLSSGTYQTAPGQAPFSAAAPNCLGPWQLETLISEGERTQVFRASPASAEGEISRHGQYAVKVLRETSQDDPIAGAQMRQEATVGRCVSHRHLAPVLLAHVHRAPYYIVLPWIDGTNVAAHLKARGRLQPATALWIARQGAQALEALHTAGYTHGDVNPNNLLFTTDGHVTLVDLGCSLRFDDGSAASNPSTDDRLFGTPNYLAPEIFVGRGADGRSDLHSLGITLFEMLAGRLPPMPREISALARLKREAPLPDVRNYTPHVSENVAMFVKELTAREPLRRPRTARAAAEQLMRLEITTLREKAR